MPHLAWRNPPSFVKFKSSFYKTDELIGRYKLEADS